VPLSSPVSAGLKDETFIRVRDLSKSFRSKTTITHALDTTSFDIRRGEFLSVVGPSGCGKSTLLMLMSGLTGATTGTVEIDGRPVTSPVSDLGIVFQEDLLLEWKRTMDNILMQGAFRDGSKRSLRSRAEELLEMVGLSDFADKYPHELSGGMRQRASICRALVHAPPLLLMDEPFGALDAMTRDQMSLDIQDLLAGTDTTVLFITHSIAEAVMLSDRVLVFGPPPGYIVDELVVDLPRPRHLSARETPEFAALSGRIRTRLQEMGVIRDRIGGHDGGHDGGLVSTEGV
jgi:NitT/TauT family transport system ATP-binding protein